jgi:hypothetical protein
VAFGIPATVRGSYQLEAVARAARNAADGTIRKDMLKGIRNAAKPVADAIKDQAAEELPGGLGEWYGGAKLAPRTRATGAKAGVRIQGPKKGRGADMGGVNDSGTARHPVFGNRAVWSDTSVPAGFEERGAEKAADQARHDMEVVMQDTLQRIARSV